MTTDNQTLKHIKKPTVAEYLEKMINMSPKTQLAMAKECKFDNSNMITMIKQGRTKLPISKVGLVARSLGLDPMHLFKMKMQEDEPETWAAIQESILNRPFVTDNEMKIIEIIRESNVINPRVRTEDERQRVLDVISTLKSDAALD